MVNSDTPLRVGIIGCGRVAQMRYLPILRSFPKARLIAAADTQPEKLDLVRKWFPTAKTFVDHRNLLEDSDVQAVIIATPPPFHAQMTLDAIAAGKHVLVEKPLTTHLADAETVAAEARASTVNVMIAFHKRAMERHENARRLLQSDIMGEPYAAECTWVSSGYHEGPWQPHTDFVRTRGEGGGVLLELTSHQIDLVRFLFGREVIAVRCYLRSRQWDDDSAWLYLTLEGGILVNIYSGFGPTPLKNLNILCERGRLAFPSSYSSLWLGERSLRDSASASAHYLKDFARAVIGNAYKPMHMEYRSFIVQLTNFADYIRRDEEPSPGIEDGVANMRVIDAAYRSAEQDGALVSLQKVG